MAHATVRITIASRESLRALARESGRPMQAVLEEAIETLRRRRFLERVNAAYAALAADPKRWSAIEAERAEWNPTLLDGLVVEEGSVSYRACKPRPRRPKRP